MDKAYNTAIAIATALVQHDSTLSFTVDYYYPRLGSFIVTILRKGKNVVVISFTECLGYFGVLAIQENSHNRNYNDVRFEAKDSDKMATYIFNILEAYKVVA